MAVTLTPLEGYLKPNGSEASPNFPAQNRQNLLAIDTRTRDLTLHTFTPSLVTSSGTQPNLGTGATTDGWFYRYLDSVLVWYRIILGTGSSPGTTAAVYGIPLPVAANLDLYRGDTGALVLGFGYIVDASNTENTTIHAHNLDDNFAIGTTVNFNVTDLGVWQVDDIFTLADGDQISGFLNYIAGDI